MILNDAGITYVVVADHPQPGQHGHSVLVRATWLRVSPDHAAAAEYARAYVLDSYRKCTVLAHGPGVDGFTQIESLWDGTTLDVDTWKALRVHVSDNCPKRPLTIPIRLNRAWCDWAHDVLKAGTGVDVEALALKGDLDALAAVVVPHLELLA